MLLCILAASSARAFPLPLAGDTTFANPQSDTGSFVDTALTESQYILSHLAEMSPRGYKEQLQTCNDFQRSGYANIAFEIDGGDGLLAFCQLLKTNLEIAFGMFHVDYAIRLSEEKKIPLPNNWDFPADPWKREWWSTQ
jgi:hypothetical protein